MRRLLLAITLAVAFLAAAYTMTGALARSTGQSAPPAGDSSPVIRFVKDPQMAPPLPDRDISGAVVSNANWTGKVVLVNFWATWCPPCREEVPELISLQRQFKHQLQIVGISEDEDTAANVLRFAKQWRINYPIVMATPEVISAYGGVPALPTTFIIDTQGRVVGKHAGLHPMDTYVLEIRALRGHRPTIPEERGERHRIARSKSHWIDASTEEGRPAPPECRELHLRMHLDSLPMPCK